MKHATRHNVEDAMRIVRGYNNFVAKANFKMYILTSVYTFDSVQSVITTPNVKRYKVAYTYISLSN